MKTPMPPIHETAAELQLLLKAERDAQKQQRLQTLYLLRTQQAHTRRQVARLLGSIAILGALAGRICTGGHSPAGDDCQGTGQIASPI
jgi:hypothetical protein